MNSYDIGDQVRVATSLTTFASGAAIDPSTLALVVRAPDGTSNTYTYALSTVLKDSTGNYHVDIPATLAGVYRYRWTSTGTGAASEEGLFRVRTRWVP